MDGEAGCHHRDVCTPCTNQKYNVEAFPMGWVSLVISAANRYLGRGLSGCIDTATEFF